MSEQKRPGWLAPEPTSDEVLATLEAKTRELARRVETAEASQRRSAMAVVEACIAYRFDGDPSCPFCNWHPPNFLKHDADCPLVEQGFIDQDGTRKE